ncbi:MAG: DUF433 domain-containing protein, partial [Pseudonocardiaceae bacterium]
MVQFLSVQSGSPLAAARSRDDLACTFRRPGKVQHKGDHREVMTMAFERISIDHEKMGGLPCIRDLRIPVSTVLGQLAAGRAAQEILEDFP